MSACSEAPFEHAWKLIPLARADAHRNASTHSRATTIRNVDLAMFAGEVTTEPAQHIEPTQR
jgi:hypothetical protein